jgi:hypothetical protein
MTDHQHARKPVPDRARKRMVRTLAAATGVPYSVAARRLDSADRAVDWFANELLASQGRTVYPASTDTHRWQLIDARAQRTFQQRIQDARLASQLPGGRARHLADRFPPTRGEPGTGVGPLYQGQSRQDTLALLYAVIAHETPAQLPSAGDLAWIAELGEETAVDTACAGMDRQARRILDHDPAGLRSRIEDALAAAQTHRDWRMRHEAIRLTSWYRTVIATEPTGGDPTTGLSADGARHILDALLVIADDGHAPGTRVQILIDPHRDHKATIVGALWGTAGPPSRYRVHPDACPEPVAIDPDDLVLLTGRHRAET